MDGFDQDWNDPTYHPELAESGVSEFKEEDTGDENNDDTFGFEATTICARSLAPSPGS